MKTQSTRTLNKQQTNKKPQGKLTADKVQTFLLKDKKKRPETAKLKQPSDLPLNQEQDEGVNLTRILSYYRARVNAHEEDRRLFLNKMEKLRIKQEQAHQIEWELKKRNQESNELVGALQQCQGLLGQERGTIEEMKDGGDNLRLKSNMNKQQILELLESSNSVEQHVYYQKGESPEKIQQYYLGTKGAGITGGPNTMAPITKPDREPVKSTLSFKQPKKPNVLRTIYMPNYEVDDAREQIEILRKEINEERQYYEDIMKNLQDDKASFENGQRDSYMVINQEYAQTLERLHQKEIYNQQVVRDHVELKHVFEIEERAMHEENEQINQENQILRQTIRVMAADAKGTIKHARQDYEINSEEFMSKFRDQNKTQDENMSIIRDQYKKLKDLYKTKTEILSEREQKESNKLQTNSSKRVLSLEGFKSDLQNLKKRMVFYQNYIGKLKKLVDRDQMQQNLEGGQANCMDIFGPEQDVILEQIAEEE